jgi:hypothetical protein
MHAFAATSGMYLTLPYHFLHALGVGSSVRFLLYSFQTWVPRWSEDELETVHNWRCVGFVRANALGLARAGGHCCRNVSWADGECGDPGAEQIFIPAHTSR